jgi:hypothetical protein
MFMPYVRNSSSSLPLLVEPWHVLRNLCTRLVCFVYLALLVIYSHFNKKIAFPKKSQIFKVL